MKAQGSGWSDSVARALFVLALCFFAFGYGIAVMKWRLFPHGLISEAFSAVKALQQVDPRALPPHFLRFETAASAQPAPDPAATPQDVIVVTGGFYYRMDLCPTFGCMAFITDRSGKMLHSWSADPASVFSPEDLALFNGFPAASEMFVQGAEMDRDGNLIVTFQGRNVFPYHVGVAKFGKDGALLWKQILGAHHWPKVGPDGRIYLPVARMVPLPPWLQETGERPTCGSGQVDQEGVRILAPDGTLIREIWIDDAAREGDFKSVSYTVRDGCDPHHVNGIDLVNEAAAARLRASGVADAAAGDLFVSLRSSSSVIVLDPDSGRILRVLYGPMLAQHSPATLPDGSLVVFDNLGDAGPSGLGTLSRILQLDPAGGPSRQIYPVPGKPEMGTLHSEAEGHVSASADGTRLLVAETYGGRVLEVERETGKVLWTYDQVEPAAAMNDLFPGTKDGAFVRQQVQGAAFLLREEFDRIFR